MKFTSLSARLILFCGLFLAIRSTTGALNPDVQLSEQDKLRIRSLFNPNQKPDSVSLPAIHYSLLGLNILHNSNLNAAFESGQKKTQLCDQLKAFIAQKNNQNLDNLYFASSSLKLLNCPVSSILQLAAVNWQTTVHRSPKINFIRSTSSD